MFRKRFSGGLAVAVGAVLTAGTMVSACDSPSGPGASIPETFREAIYYQRFDAASGLVQVFSVLSTGADERRVAPVAGTQTHPALSPDGRTMAFRSTHEGFPALYLIAPGDTSPRLLTDLGSPFAPAWSPDGQAIAFSAWQNGVLDIYSVAADGSGVTRLTDTPDLDFSPVWSPDGTVIAYTVDEGSGPQSIHVMSADGSNQRALVQGPLEPGESLSSPTWSPDGLRIAFVHSGNTPVSIHTMTADGENRQPLAIPPITVRAYTWPVWSPDGARIAFVAIGDGTSASLLTVTLADSVVATIAAVDGISSSPFWAR
ncbi:MAG: LpqB family beta-propeller domain-containing protein [Gemmatimonadota bacterium]